MTNLLEMKILLLTLFIAPTLSFAQNYKDNQARFYLNRLYSYGKEIELYDLNQFGSEIRTEQLKENGVRTVTVERGRSEKNTSKVRYVLNDNGFVNRIEHPKDTIHYSYIHDSLVESVEITGKTERLSTYEYKNGLLTKKEVFEKDRLSSRVLMGYTEDEKVDFSLLQKGRKLKKSYSMDYEYEDGKIRQQQFVRNDKIIRTWDYTCEPKGQTLEEKTTSTLCKVVEESNDGSYVVHIRKVEDGKVLLYTHRYDKDSVNYASSCEKETGEMVWSTQRDGNTRTTMNFDNSGQLRSKSVATYDENDRILELAYTFGKKQKRTSTTQYTYNEKGLLATQTSFYKGKESYFRKYIYG
jgi:hypothetical protein